MRWPRHRAPPDDVRSLLTLEPGERVLAAAATAGGGTVVATDRALHVVSPARTTSTASWVGILQAVWDHDTFTLSITREGPAGARPQVLRLALPEPGRLPEVVRERVQASILISQRVVLRGRSGVTVVARREPGATDISWHVVHDPGVDPADPQWGPLIEQALDELRSQVEP